MLKTESAQQLYDLCKDMDLDETMELVLTAKTEDDVKRRYKESLANLRQAIPLCGLVILYDNTDSFRPFPIIRNGNYVTLSKNILDWFKKWQLENEISC